MRSANKDNQPTLKNVVESQHMTGDRNSKVAKPPGEQGTELSAKG